MTTREDRIMSLATTLKTSGLAKSESQARMMAEEMIGVEEHVQKRFDEEHTKAQEFLKTAKNLGQPQMRAVPESSRQLIRPVVMEPAKVESVQNVRPKNQTNDSNIVPLNIGEIRSENNFGNKTLKDLMFEQIKEDHHDIKNIEEIKPQEAVEPVKSVDVTDIKLVAPQVLSDVSKDVNTAHVFESSSDNSVDSQQGPVLDSKKLVELMEEDGKLEEHTREIKEKPKFVKPKEEYAENNIDLSLMFNVHK